VWNLFSPGLTGSLGHFATYLLTKYARPLPVYGLVAYHHGKTRRSVRFAVMAAFATVAASAHGQTGDWGNLAVISSTLGNNANRLCVGEGLRDTDIGCPTYAPYVSATSGFVGIGTSTPDSPLVVRGPDNGVARWEFKVLNLAGTNESGFYQYSNNAVALQLRNGSGSLRVSLQPSGNSYILDNNVGIGTTNPNAKLDVYGTISATNLLINGQPVGGQADRITSGTTNVIATQDRSVTITTAGSQRVTVGENGNVGFGTADPSSSFHVYGLGRANFTGIGNAIDLNIGRPGSSSDRFTIGWNFPSHHGYWQSASGLYPLVIQPTGGNVGVGTTTPTATLQVSGSFIVSTSAQTTTPSLYVGTNGNVGVGTSNPQTPFHFSNPGSADLWVETTTANNGYPIPTQRCRYRLRRLCWKPRRFWLVHRNAAARADGRRIRKYRHRYCRAERYAHRLWQRHRKRHCTGRRNR
jgi:hypothetical protein